MLPKTWSKRIENHCWNKNYSSNSTWNNRSEQICWNENKTQFEDISHEYRKGEDAGIDVEITLQGSPLETCSVRVTANSSIEEIVYLFHQTLFKSSIPLGKNDYKLFVLEQSSSQDQLHTNESCWSEIDDLTLLRHRDVLLYCPSQNIRSYITDSATPNLKLKRKERSVSGKFRHVSSLSKKGLLDKFEVGILKDGIVAGDQSVDKVLKQYEWDDDGKSELSYRQSKFQRPRGRSLEDEFYNRLSLQNAARCASQDILMMNTPPTYSTTSLLNPTVTAVCTSSKTTTETERSSNKLQRSQARDIPSPHRPDLFDIPCNSPTMNSPQTPLPRYFNGNSSLHTPCTPELVSNNVVSHFVSVRPCLLNNDPLLNANNIVFGDIIKSSVVHRDFERNYSLGNVLGQGNCSIVYKGQKLSTGETFAIKVVNKMAVFHPKYLVQEIEILGGIYHRHIIKLYDLYEDDNYLYIVLEYADGELFDLIECQGKINEKQSRLAIRNLVDATNYLHDKNIVHRDIKPENILLRNNSDISNLILTDFGIARQLEEGTDYASVSPDASPTESSSSDGCSRPRLARAHTKCGTREYVAPEVMCGNGYGLEADMWSIGVVAYVLLSGCSPSIYDDKVDFSGECWSTISPLARDFIGKLLIQNPDGRMTARDALGHQWFCIEEQE